MKHSVVLNVVFMPYVVSSLYLLICTITHIGYSYHVKSIFLILFHHSISASDSEQYRK